VREARRNETANIKGGQLSEQSPVMIRGAWKLYLLLPEPTGERGRGSWKNDFTE